MNRRYSRRRFLGQTLGAGLVLAGMGSRPGRAGAAKRSPNDELGVLAVGVRGRGAAVAVGSCAFGRVVACADVDTDSRDRFFKHLAEVQQQTPAFYRDYRKALEHPGVDVVTIGTPDHWHTRILLDAIRAGKDVYVEKPMCLTVDEGTIVCEAVRKTGRVVQVGTQQRSEYDGIFLKMVALAHSGRLGPKLTATVKVPPQYGKSTGPFPVTEPPETLDWDTWLGQVQKVPYCDRRCHGSWRNWVETGYGPLADWGVHHVDIAQWAIGAEHSGPVEVEGKGTWPQGREGTLAVLLGKKPSTSLPNGFSTVIDYEAELRFASGHTIRTDGRKASWESGPRHVGTEIKGAGDRIWGSRRGKQFELTGEVIETIEADKAEREKLTEAAIALYKGKTPEWAASAKQIGDVVPTAHMRNFVDCVRDRSEPISDVWTHHRSMTSCMLASIAILVGRTITWDPEKEKIVGDEEANALLRRQQRPPYTIDGSV
jgi:predicted dehydrogenase